MKRYLFISNSNKKTREKETDEKILKLGNVRKPCLDAAHKMGYEIWLGVNRNNIKQLSTDADYPVNLYDSHTYRSIFNIKDNLIAYRNTMNLLKKGDFEVIHCNTPIGGVIGRICGKKAKVRKVIYTAHGFHFYKGAPIFNRLILKNAEKIMAHWTDAIITMNQEDYVAAKKFKLRNNGKVYFIPGVGIDSTIYENVNVDKVKMRLELGLKETDIVCISMGDLIPRKNYGTAIEAIKKCNNTNIHYIICGDGPELDKLKELAYKNQIEKNVHFLGYRKDIKELLKISDIFLFTTLQEGMPRAMMEAMASGLPCIASKIRGNIDLLENEKGGYLVDVLDIENISRKINLLAKDSDLREKMSIVNHERIRKVFDIKEVEKKIDEIYSDILK